MRTQGHQKRGMSKHLGFLALLPTVRGAMSPTSVTKGLVSFWATTSSPARSAGVLVTLGISWGSFLTS